MTNNSDTITNTFYTGLLQLCIALYIDYPHLHNNNKLTTQALIQHILNKLCRIWNTAWSIATDVTISVWIIKQHSHNNHFTNTFVGDTYNNIYM